MDLIHELQYRVLHLLRRPATWWSDIRFFWSTLDKASLALQSVAVVTIVSVTGFVTYYFSTQDERRDRMCLALNVYHEARGEPLSGQFAVAEVTMNRVASKNYPNSVCEVVYQQNWDPERKRFISMFSWTGQEMKPVMQVEAWQKAIQVAQIAYSEDYAPKLEGALFFHARYVKPRWSKTKQPKARIGRHIFY